MSHAITVLIDDISAESPNYVELVGTGNTGSTGTGPLKGVPMELAGTGATASTGTGLIRGVYLVLAGTGATASTGTGRVSGYVALVGTAATDTAAEGILKLFLGIENHQVLSFDSGGTVAFTIGETLTGGTSGATGTVISTVLTGGTWGGGNAAGTVILGDVVGSFIDNEHLNGSIAGVNAGDANGTLSYTGPKVIRKSVWKGIDDAYWAASITCSGIYGVSQVANFREVEVLIPDHEGTDQQVFLGVVPDFGTSHSAATDMTTINAVGHAWYLSNRYMPDDYLSNTVWDDDDDRIEYIEPSVIVTALYGGANWLTLCGINPSNIVPVTAWNYPLPAKGWAWRKGTKRFDAIREMCEYLDYVSETTFPGTSQTPAGVFCPLASIGDYTPDPVTFAHDDSPNYIVSITKRAPGGEKPSLVTVNGARNYRILYFTDGVNEFAADNKLDLIGNGIFTNGSAEVPTEYDYRQELNVGDYIYDSDRDDYTKAKAITKITNSLITLSGNYTGTGGSGYSNLSKYTGGYGTLLDGTTGAQGFISSFTVESGTWAGDDAAGYIILTYDRTGSFSNGGTIIDTRGAAYGSAIAKGSDEFYELYDYYQYSYPETDPDLAVEYYEDVPPEVDSASLIETYAVDLYTFLQMDNNEYTVVFNKRADLRLWQEVTITGYTEIPEVAMRIVHIRYDQEPARVTVTCTLRNAEYVETMVKRRRTAQSSDAAALERVIQKMLDKHITVTDAEIIKADGTGYTAEIIDGDVVVRAQGA